MSRLCLSVGKQQTASVSINVSSRTWNIAPEISTCTSDLSVDSITRVGLLSKGLSFLDMLENSTFLAISGMDESMFWVSI